MATKKSYLQKHRPEVIQFIEYMIGGGAFFWSGYIVFYISDKMIGLSFFWAKSASYVVGWTVNFLLQRYWAFNSKKLKGKQVQVTGKYIFITAVNFLIDYLIVGSLKALGLTPYIGQFVSAGFFTIWNYLWYKLWVFKPSTKKAR
jgi:putative flippase GtrA